VNFYFNFGLIWDFTLKRDALKPMPEIQSWK
jgi:hypothetical protein